VSQSRSAVAVTRTTVTRRFPRVTTVASAVVLTVSTILVLFPYLFAVSTSTKTYNEFLHQFLLPTLPPNVNNYVIAWQLVSTYILNTALVTVLSVIPSLLFASMSAYVFARHRFPGRDALFLVILSLIMIPGIVSLLPRFIVVMQLGLLNSYWALVLPYISGSQVFAIFVLRTFIAELPEELFEAARIDGATDLQMYYQIAIPLSKAILGTLAIDDGKQSQCAHHQRRTGVPQQRSAIAFRSGIRGVRAGLAADAAPLRVYHAAIYERPYLGRPEDLAIDHDLNREMPGPRRGPA